MLLNVTPRAVGRTVPGAPPSPVDGRRWFHAPPRLRARLALRVCRGWLVADSQRDQLHPRSLRCAHLRLPLHVSYPAGAARAPFFTGEPTSSVHPRRAGVEARPYGRHPHLTHVAPTPQSRRKAPRQLPFQGSRGAWEEVCGDGASAYRDADSYVSLTPVRGGVLDAPWLRDCRGGVVAAVGRG